jgi:ParB family chromosome partitioning protein
MLRLLVLPEEVKQMLRQNELSMGHAKAILALNSPQQMVQVAKAVLKQKLSVRQIEKLAKGGDSVAIIDATSTPQGAAEKTKLSAISDLANRLQRTLATKVEIQYQSGRGKVEIHFYSDDELNEIIQKMEPK